MPVQSTQTQVAKALYSKLLELQVIDRSTRGLVGNRLYISQQGDRAYRLEELSDNHLQRIIDKYKRADMVELLAPLLLERERRVGAGTYEPWPAEK